MVKLKFELRISEDFTEFNYKTQKYTKNFEDKITLIEALDELMGINSLNSHSVEIDNLNKITWGKYFKDDIIMYIENSILEEKLIDLENQFNISKDTIILNVDFPGVGGEVGRSEGIILFFHFDEKDRHSNYPHIHCRYAEEEVSIYLNTLEVVGKRFNHKKLKEALRIVELNKENLLNYWDKVIINGESCKLKLEIK